MIFIWFLYYFRFRKKSHKPCRPCMKLTLRPLREDSRIQTSKPRTPDLQAPDLQTATGLGNHSTSCLAAQWRISSCVHYLCIFLDYTNIYIYIYYTCSHEFHIMRLYDVLYQRCYFYMIFIWYFILYVVLYFIGFLYGFGCVCIKRSYVCLCNVLNLYIICPRRKDRLLCRPIPDPTHSGERYLVRAMVRSHFWFKPCLYGYIYIYIYQG